MINRSNLWLRSLATDVLQHCDCRSCEINAAEALEDLGVLEDVLRELGIVDPRPGRLRLDESMLDEADLNVAVGETGSFSFGLSFGGRRQPSPDPADVPVTVFHKRVGMTVTVQGQGSVEANLRQARLDMLESLREAERDRLRHSVRPEFQLYVIHAGRVLVLRNVNGWPTLPSGLPEFGEDPEAAARRILQVTTGAQGEPEFLRAWRSAWGMADTYVLTFFVSLATSVVHTTEEWPQFEWVAPEELERIEQEIRVGAGSYERDAVLTGVRENVQALRQRGALQDDE